MLGLPLTSLPWRPLQVARSVSVHGHGYLTLALKDVPGLRDFYSGFSFQTSQHEGLLYHHATQVGTCWPPSYPGRGGRNINSCSLGVAVLLLGKGRDFGGVREGIHSEISTLSSWRVVVPWTLVLSAGGDVPGVPPEGTAGLEPAGYQNHH